MRGHGEQGMTPISRTNHTLFYTPANGTPPEQPPLPDNPPEPMPPERPVPAPNPEFPEENPVDVPPPDPAPPPDDAPIPKALSLAEWVCEASFAVAHGL